MTPTEKLNTLAKWLDIMDDERRLPVPERDVQRDLRNTARLLAALEAEVAAARKWKKQRRFGRGKGSLEQYEKAYAAARNATDAIRAEIEGSKAG